MLSIPVYLTIGIYVRVKFGLSEWFWLPVGLMLIGQELLLIVPDSGGRNTKLHLLGAYGALVAMLLLTCTVLLFASVSVALNIVMWSVIGLWLLVAVGLYFGKLGKWTLPLEMSIIAGWVVVLYSLVWG